jgi:VWFA-related protein
MLGILTAVGSLAPAHGRPPAAPVTWLIFVDDLHIDFRDTGYLRKMLTSIATELIRDGDSFAMRSSGPSSLSIALTSNRAQLDAAIPKASGNGLVPSDLVRPETSDEVWYRAKVAGTVAAELLNDLPKGTIGRRALLYISNGYYIPVDASVVGLPRIAEQSAVTVYALNPRGLRRASQATGTGNPPLSGPDAVRLTSLRAIAEPTGGFAILEEADFAGALQRIGRAMR